MGSRSSQRNLPRPSGCRPTASTIIWPAWKKPGSSRSPSTGRCPGGKAERVYAPAAVEPPGDEASPEDTARLFSAVIEATRADVTSALMVRESGQRRDISLTRTGLRLSDADRAELLAAFERLIREAKAKESPDGTWTHITWTAVDTEDRTPRLNNSPPRRQTSARHPPREDSGSLCTLWCAF